MAPERLTMLDIAKRDADTVEGLIDEVARLRPEWSMVPARPISGTSFKTRVRTALPTVGFREPNEGVESKKGTAVLRTVECYPLDCSWSVDTVIARAASDGPEAVTAEQAGEHIEAGIRHSCSQFYYGTSNDAKGFPGLVTGVDSGMEVDAGGSTALTSAWGVCFGPKRVQWVVGQDGNWDGSEVIRVPVEVSGKTMWTFAQELVLWHGLKIGHKYSIGRIKKLGTDTGKGLTDTLLDSLVEKFLTQGMVPDVIFMHPRSLGQLKTARTATNATGEPPPWPAGYALSISLDGEMVQRIIPYIVTTSITVAE